MDPGDQPPSSTDPVPQLDGTYTSRSNQPHTDDGAAAAAPTVQSVDRMPGASTTSKQNDFIVDLDCNLGEGDFGGARLGWNQTESNLIAVKKIAIKANDESLSQEIKILGHLRKHDHVLHLVAYVFDSNRMAYWLFFEFCDMGNLEEYVKRHEPGPHTSVEIMHQVAEAVAFMHSQSNEIVHGDIKPQHVMMTYQDHSRPIAKVAGFGNPKCGTPYFMSPELLEKDIYTSSADVFSAGLLFLGLINFKHTRHVMPIPEDVMSTPGEATVSALLRSLSIGMMMLFCKEKGVECPDINYLGDNPIFIEAIEVVRSMIQIDPKYRVTSKKAELEMKRLFDRVQNQLEEAPAKPTARQFPFQSESLVDIQRA